MSGNLYRRCANASMSVVRLHLPNARVGAVDAPAKDADPQTEEEEEEEEDHRRLARRAALARTTAQRAVIASATARSAA
jgi:hypothetical protein